MQTIIKLLAIVIGSVVLLVARPAEAQDAVAQQAAEDIVRSLAAGQFKDVWNQKVSKFLKDRVSEDVFLANMAMGRPQLGKLVSLKLVSSNRLSKDPATGFEGDIFFVVFRNAYAAGEFYEHVAVVKDADGKYRFSGINGAPVPKQ